MSNKNPFADLFGSFNSCSFNTEAFNLDKVVAASRLNAKAWTDAWKAASEGTQVLYRRQAEIAQAASEEFTKLCKDFASNVKSPEAGIAKQAEYTKCSFEAAIANSKELFEIATKSGGQATEILNDRVSSALKEIKDLAVNSNSAESSSAANNQQRKNRNEAA
jgi:phasin family protein